MRSGGELTPSPQGRNAFLSYAPHFWPNAAQLDAYLQAHPGATSDEWEDKIVWDHKDANRNAGAARLRNSFASRKQTADAETPQIPETRLKRKSFSPSAKRPSSSRSRTTLGSSSTRACASPPRRRRISCYGRSSAIQRRGEYSLIVLRTTADIVYPSE